MQQPTIWLDGETLNGGVVGYRAKDYFSFIKNNNLVVIFHFMYLFNLK